MKTLTTHINESIKPLFRGNLKQSPYKAVDLGLSVKWCSCNVGAKSPEDPGLLFQWGRTDGYKYDDENHGFLSEDNYVTTSGTKYKPGETLKLEDDAAHVNMKYDWRMPTKEEIDELLELKYEWTELNGVKGYKFTSENGNSIFIPAAGFFRGNNGSFINSGYNGYVWSSSVTPSNANYGYNLGFYSSNCFLDDYHRYNGFSVRGVCE